ncbi:hypothetical protein ZWY2020_034899 [Hordeum vulgare]|nr:hypothetical protein ZWY2020_034899 [Hordeum vulgare]
MEQPTLKRRRRLRHNQTKDSSLPEELLEEIFARLPAKSARRLRCLSRSWSATLSSSSFADLHLERANQREGPPKLLFTTAQYRFHAWRHGAGSVAAERLTAGVLPLPRLEPARAVEVLTVKPCHGLVLLRRKYFRGHYLCNPCTGQLSLLPDSDMPSKIMFGPRRRHINNSLVAYGLGYSSKAKQHKVVRLISLHDEGTASCDVLPLDGVSVHWRPAAHQPAASCNTYHASIAWPVAAVFFNGHLHFLQHHHQGQVVITTFDVSDESFSSLPAPPGLENVPFGLAVLDGCLCAHYNGLPLNGDDPFYISRLVRATGQWEQLCCIQRQAWPALLPPSRWVYPLEIYHDDGHNKKIMFAPPWRNRMGRHAWVRGLPCGVEKGLVGCAQVVAGPFCCLTEPCVQRLACTDQERQIRATARTTPRRRPETGSGAPGALPWHLLSSRANGQAPTTTF